jgi:hypothetical protein
VGASASFADNVIVEQPEGRPAMVRAQLVLSLVIAFALSMFAVPVRAQSEGAETLQSVGQSASAGFNRTDGCITTSVIVLAGQQISGPGRTTFAVVLIDSRNTCTDTLLVFGGGTASGVNFRMDPQLKKAAVHASVPFDDIVSNSTFNVQVDMVWTGTGALERGQDQFTFEDEGFTIIAHSVGAARDATASGAVASASTTFVPAGSTAPGFLFWFNQGQVIISPHPSQ